MNMSLQLVSESIEPIVVKHSDCFNTPDHVFKQLNNIFEFELDAACDSTNKKCPYGFQSDKGVNGLTESWSGFRVFCNPPFSQKEAWILKAIDEVENHLCPICVMILPLNCMSAEAFFKNVIMGGYFYEIVNKRIQFLDNKTKKPISGNDSGTVIVYFKKRIKAST